MLTGATQNWCGKHNENKTQKYNNTKIETHYSLTHKISAKQWNAF